MDKKFLSIDNIAEYVKGYALEGDFYFHEAIKTATVQARKVKEGEVIDTKTSDGFDETKNVGIKDEKGELGWVVTNPGGEQYIVSNDEFNKAYTQVAEGEYVKGNPVIVMELENDIAFDAPWGEEMRIQKGGYLVINGKDDIYGIQKASFDETYRMTDKLRCDAYMEMGKIMEFDENTICEMEFNNFLSGAIKGAYETDTEKHQDKFQVNLDNILSELRKGKEPETSKDNLSNSKVKSSDDVVL